MKVFNNVLALVVISLGAFIQMTLAHPTWSEYKRLYNKAFTPAEDLKREKIYNANMKIADEMSAKNPLAKFGHNEFSHMSAAEFKVYHNAEAYYKREAENNKNVEQYVPKLSAAAVTKIDWRKKGAVTYVKNQGQCGSCWSFSTTGGIEGAWFNAGHDLVAVSEQEFVSCDQNDDGCNGGLMQNAFKWAIDSWSGWVTSESAYPYVSGMGQVPACEYTGKPKVSQITSYKTVAHSETAIATALVDVGPIPIAVDATSWQTYSGGILTNCVSSQVDHGVLLVGMDLDNSPKYWIVKNSWGQSWGEEGYIRIGYGTDQCLITYDPVYPIASKGPAPPPGPTSAPSGSGSGSQPTSAPSGSGSGSQPTTAAPSGSGSGSGTFTQYQCTNSLCLSDCQSNTFPQN
jgi:C1A family cysteine protease